MLMSLPEVFPNPGPITSTPKKPTASPMTMRITTKTTSDDEADMIHTLTNGTRSRPGSADHQLQVRSCPVSPIGSENPVSHTDCKRSPSAQHASSMGESAPAPAVVIETSKTNLNSPVLTDMCETNASTSSLPSSDEVATKPAALKVVGTTTLVETADQTNTLPVTNKSCSLTTTPLIPGYRTVQNHLKADPKSIKQRLLSALTDMIPHRETLSLRLLVNYTIDDKDSECVVIDETLCRQKDSLSEKKSHGKRGPDNSIPTDCDDSGFCSELSETETKRIKCERLSTTNEAHVLDLSLHTEREDKELNEAMITEQEDSSDSQSASFPGQRFHLSSDPRSTVTSTDGLRTATNVSTILSSTSTLPFLDSTVLTLLPFLQQQQQQQQQPQQQRQGFSFTIPAKPPVASMNSVSENSIGSNVPETAEMLLLKELQALLNAPNGTLQSGATTLQLNPLRSLNNNVTPSTTNAAATDASTAAAAAAAAAAALELGGTNGLGNHSRTSLTSTASLPSALTSSPLIGFPLLHPFGTDNMTAVQALLPTSTPNFTSFNFSPTAVLSLKDKTNGFDHAIGSKTFSQPMVSSLNPITVPQTGSVSLRTTLSTLSQLFAGSTPDGNGQNSGSVSVSNMLESNGTETKRLSLDALTASLAGGFNESKLSNLSSSGSTMEVLGKQILLKTLDLSAVGQAKHTSHETEPNGPRSGMRLNSTLVTGTSSSTASSILTTAMTNNIANSGTTARHTNSTEHSAKSLSTSRNAPTTMTTAVVAATATATSTTGTNLSTSNGTYSTSQFAFGRRLTNTRRFVCNQCRKNFASLAELNRHTLEAHNSFKCTICSAHFTQRSNLQRHSLKHVGFKPFTCNLCKKEYYRKDHLVRHIEVTHPNHDPKMNITVHLTSSECLDYLDRLHAGKQTPSSNGSTEFRDTTEEDPEELIDLEEMRIEDPAASGIELTETDQTGVCDEVSSPMTEND